MKNKIILMTFFVLWGLSFSLKAAIASPNDYPCGTEEQCKAKCAGGSFQKSGLNILQCTQGWKSGTAALGAYCEKSTECVSGAYCEDPVIGFNKCAAKKANGAQCDDCLNECTSKNFVTIKGQMNTDARLCAAANGQAPATGSGTGSGTSASGSANNKQFYNTETECKNNCSGGSCSFVLSKYRCDIASTSTTPGAAQTASGGLNSAGSVTISNPLQYDSVEGFLGAVLSGARQIIVVLALVFIVIGAIMYVISAGQSGMMETAKKTITMAMVGLAIGIAAPSFLKEISKILGWNSTDSSMSGALTLSQIAMNVLNFLLGIFGTLAIIMLLIGGIMYMTSAGDDNRIEAGKKIFKYSVIGIVLALASLVIVQQIAKLLA